MSGTGIKRYVAFTYEGRPDPLNFYAHGLDVKISTRLKQISMVAPSDKGTPIGSCQWE